LNFTSLDVIVQLIDIPNTNSLILQLLEAGQVGGERIAQLKSKYSQLYEHVKG